MARGVSPNATGRGVAIVMNTAAGSARDELLDELRTALPDAKVVVVGDDDDLQACLRDAARNATVLGIAGGDGSVNAAAALALELDLPLLVVPGGTLNHFARDIGLETVEDAIAAVQEGATQPVDVGRLADRIFLNTASFGSYPMLVTRREALESRIGKWPAFVVALFQVLRTYEPCSVDIDGRRRHVWMIFVGNCAYEPPGLAPRRRRSLDDRTFDARIVDSSPHWSRTRLLVTLLFRRAARSQVLTRTLAEALEVTMYENTPLSVDGEAFEGPRTFTIEKHLTRLVVFGGR